MTLIEAEDLEMLQRELRRNAHPGRMPAQPRDAWHRAPALIGKRFRVGAVECLGIRMCPPCNHLEELTRPGPLRGLARSGGIRAHILTMA